MMTLEEVIVAVGYLRFNVDRPGKEYSSLPDGITAAEIDNALYIAFKDFDAGVADNPYARKLVVVARERQRERDRADAEYARTVRESRTRSLMDEWLHQQMRAESATIYASDIRFTRLDEYGRVING